MKTHMQEVLEIEKRAQAIQAAALQEANQIPITAEQESQALLERTRSEAEEEARRLVEKARTQKQGEQILAQADKKAAEMKSLAMTHLDRAVNYVLDRIAGRE